MALKGNLTDISIADLVQLNCQSGAQACLTVEHNNQKLKLYFDMGEIAHAQWGRVEGEEAFYKLLSWETGMFEVEQNVAPPAHTITVPWTALIMEGLRRVDEARLNDNGQSDEGEKENKMETTKKRSEVLAGALQRMVNDSSDIQGVVIISMDGLVIASELPSKMDQARVGAVAAGILSLSGRSVGQLARGDLMQTLIQGSDGNVILTYAGKNAAFVALTGREVNLGMAFLEAREGAQKIGEILG